MKALVVSGMPIGQNGSISRQRTSMYWMPRAAKAVDGRSPRSTVRLGRMLE